MFLSGYDLYIPLQFFRSLFSINAVCVDYFLTNQQSAVAATTTASIVVGYDRVVNKLNLFIQVYYCVSDLFWVSGC